MGAIDTAKTTTHAAPKDGRTRNRGFQAGQFPTRGPFLIHQPAGPTGKRYYLTGQYAKRSPPPEGWIDWIALEFGPGNYKVASEHEEPAFVVITEPMVARAQRRAAAGSTRPPDPTPPPPRQRQLALAEDDDDEDEDEDEEELEDTPRTRRNPPPPADPVAAIADRLHELERIRAIFGPAEPAAPPPPDLMQTLVSNPALMQMLGRLLAPAQPNPSPAPATPSIDPAWRELITTLETHGIGPERLRQMLTPSPPPPANDAPHDAHDELEPT